MNVSKSTPTFQEGCLYIQEVLEKAQEHSVKTIKELALPIISSLGKIGSSGIDSIKYAVNLVSQKFSDLIALFNKLICRLDHDHMETIPADTSNNPIEENDSSLNPAPVPETTEPLLQERLINLSKELQLDIKSHLENIKAISIKYYPEKEQIEEFLANLEIELNALSDTINYDIDPVTKNIEEYLLPKEIVFANIKLASEFIVEKIQDLIIAYYPSKETQTLVINQIKSELHLAIDKIKSEFHTTKEKIISESILSEELNDQVHREKVKNLNHIDAGDLY